MSRPASPFESRPSTRSDAASQPMDASSHNVSARPPIRHDASSDADPSPSSPDASRTLASPDDWRGTDLDLRDVV